MAPGTAASTLLGAGDERVDDDDRQPPSGAATAGGTTWSPVWAGLALLLAAVLPLLRQRGVRPWDTVWAEDGQIFVQDALHGSLLEPLLRGYAGYAQLTSRLLAMPVRLLPAEWIAHYLAVAGTVVSALLALFVYRMSGSHVRNEALRLGLAVACVLHPVLLPENTATVVNLLWLQLFACFWAVASSRARRYDVVARSVVAFLAVTTSPLAGAYLPLLAWVVWRRRRRAEGVVAAAFLVGMAIQLWVVTSTSSVEQSSPSAADDLAGLYPVRVLGTALLGDDGTGWLWTRLGLLLVPVLAAAAVAVLAPAVLRANAEVRELGLAALGLSVVLYCVPVYVRGTSAIHLVDGIYTTHGARYAVVPVLLFLSAVAILYQPLASARPRVGMACALVLAVVVVTGFRGSVVGRSDGPSWAAGLEDARVVCVWTDASSGPVPISPLDQWEWHVDVPCGRLLGD